MRVPLSISLAFALALSAIGAFAEEPSGNDASLIPKRRTQRRHIPGTSLTQDTLCSGAHVAD